MKARLIIDTDGTISISIFPEGEAEQMIVQRISTCESASIGKTYDGTHSWGIPGIASIKLTPIKREGNPVLK